MGVEIEIGLPEGAVADALAVPVTEPPSNLTGDVRGQLQRVAESGELRGQRGEAVAGERSGDYYRVAGGTGYGVRLFAELASSFA